MASTDPDTLRAILAVRPAWSRVVRARDAVALPDRTLLHAGPPYRDPRRPVPPVLSSAVLACQVEGWAADERAAEQLIASGAVTLRPAKAFGIVAPLAAVVSPRSTLVEVIDAAGVGAPSWSLLGSGAGPQIRFGTRDPAVAERLRWRDAELAPALARALDAPIALLPIAAAGLAGGDDLHARTTAATAALAALLGPRLGRDEPASRVGAMLAATPLFFLTLWIAACRTMLSAAHRVPDSTLVVALAGNGEEVGIKLARAPERWITVPATPPQGPRLATAADARPIGLIGDSGVIDIAGFGGQRLHAAPEMRAALAAFLPPDAGTIGDTLFAVPHPQLAGVRVGLDAARVAATGVTPLVTIAMVDADGRAGLLGRGVWRAPAALFDLR